MKNIFILVTSLILASCSFKYAKFNTDENKIVAKKTRDKFFQNQKLNNQIKNFKLVSVENAVVIIGKDNNTLKEVYKMVYEVENENTINQLETRFVKKNGKTKFKFKKI